MKSHTEVFCPILDINKHTNGVKNNILFYIWNFYTRIFEGRPI